MSTEDVIEYHTSIKPNKKKKCIFEFCNRYNILRICMIFITLIFIFVSLMYACGQVLELQLDSWFCKPKSLEEITQHSVEHGFNGGTNIGCWTNSTNKVDLQKLFFAGSYVAYKGQWIQHNAWNIIQCILFSIPLAILLLILIYFTYRLFQDICVFNLGNWGKIAAMNSKQKADKFTNPNHTCSCICASSKWFDCLTRIYNWFTTTDSKGWIFKTLLVDNLKIMLQTLAFFQYGGAQNDIFYIRIFDKKPNITPAEQSKYLILFAICLSLHSITLAISWSLYIFKHDLCMGRFFKISIFIINGIFHVFYFIFPLLLLGQQNWKDIKTVMAKLHIDEWIVFVAILSPLYFLCWNVYRVWSHSTKLARDEWIQNVLPNKQNKNLAMQMTSLIAVDDNVEDNNEDMKTNYNWLSTTMPNCDNKKCFFKEFMKRFAILSVSMIWIIFGVWILTFTITHFDNSITKCNNYHNFKHEYPELFLWKYCNYKVYPFFADKKYYENG
eukprot:477040_1